MKPTSEILERINESSIKHQDGVFTRLYRYLLREDIYFAAYQKLYVNKGATTRGIDEDTADGFSRDYISGLIRELREGKYKPNPVRRQYIPKANGKMRPLGIPSFRDKLLQEAIRMILEAIYEPIFYDESHGFRPSRSCHTALLQMKNSFRSVSWFIDGDIKGCFDNIDHEVLINTLQKKIKDSKFVNVIRLFLKAGYVEDFTYSKTLSGTPQGGVISPILANIYLHELDTKVMEIKAEFDKPATRYKTKEYISVSKRRQTLQKVIARSVGDARKSAVEEYHRICKMKRATPAKMRDDKKLVYCRYADDFIIGVSGTKQECEEIKDTLKSFLKDNYHLDLSVEKTKIVHSSDYVRFLGFDVAVRRNQTIMKRSDGVRIRSLNNSVDIAIPLEDKIMNFLFKNGIIEQKQNGTIWPICVPKMRHMTELDIVNRYNAQVRGICNYYSIASNYDKLHYFRYLMEYSCLKTLASKSNSTTSKMFKKYHTSDGWGIPYMTSEGVKCATIAKLAECKAGRKMMDKDPWKYESYEDKNLAIKQRLERNICELCGKYSSQCSVYHAGSMKNLDMNTPWGERMKAIRRKTLIVCEDCNKKIRSKH